MRLITSLIALLVFLSCLAQQKKVEKEVRLKDEQIPSELQLLLEPYLSEVKKISFYRETDGEKKSYEAKFKYQGRFFSIEFDESYQLEDVEMIVSEKEIAPKVMEVMKEALTSYKRFKFEKIQKQFTSESLEDQEVIGHAVKFQKGDRIRMEVEISVKAEGKWQWYEMLFSEDGAFISKKIIVKRSSDFILY